MSGTETTNGAGGASAVLRDVFRIPGRGGVVVFDGLDGIVNVGDMAMLPDRALRVAGIEMIAPMPSHSRRDDSIGLILAQGEKAALLALVGTRVAFETGAP